MQKLIWASLLAILAVIFVQGCSKNEEKIVMATAAEFPPFEYKEGNEFKGIDVEIAQEVAKILGKTLEIKDMEFDSVVSAVSSANVDFGASGLTINEARSKVVDFTTSYYNANQVVIIKNSDSELKAVGDNAAELIKAINKKNGIKIGVQTGTTGAFYAQGDKDWGFEGFKNAEVKGFVNGSLAVSALENGQIDIVIIDEAPARLISKNYANTEVLSAYLTEERYGIAVKKGNQELLNSINQALEKMRTEGVLDKIIKKYY
ncbi:ABC transporter substrate-binding protein [Helicobacter sp. UBA3407]|uniref:ABC transporter substrate-binding protein n=1 Tax=Helicobacter sp. UBA3407 TaxID=1946588 RepID=UPI0026202F56|nr:ABC transporter substrate-binding protein [Helicobacter sp. UBA3407]